MKFKEFIDSKNISVINAAKDLGVTKQRLYMLINDQPVSRALSQKIEEWSFGKISRLETLYPGEF